VLFFRDLADVPVDPGASDDELLAPLADAWYEPESPKTQFVPWLRAWGARVREDDHRAVMDSLNPRYVLRNYLAQEAIDLATTGDASLVWDLLDVLRRPYDDQPDRERFARKRPEWARTKVGCSMLSCSS
jgi:uncharacterized protein YdiU (UPF0061 family)